MEHLRQPHLHDHLTCVHAPATWLSPRDGQLRAGADGLYVADRRVLSRFEITINGAEPVPLRATEVGSDQATFIGHLTGLGDHSPDPTVWCERRRQVRAHGGQETISLTNQSRETITAEVSLMVAADLAALAEVKSGLAMDPVPAHPAVDGLDWCAADGLQVHVHASRSPAIDAPTGTLRWAVTIPRGATWVVVIDVTCTPPHTTGFRPLAATGRAPWIAAPPRIRAADARLDRLLEASVTDLSALLLADPLCPADSYPSAGSPWYLTMFARDALWASMLALPLGPELLGSTLRSLARRQGTRVDPGTEEQPGKIPHELRPTDAARWLPPVYYGTIDATALFVVALAEAWRWGLPATEVADLLPAMERALAWMAEYGDPDGDGFIEYLGQGSGLVNQGWKDSRDGVQYADGRIATAPIALAEVQAYAYQAAMDGARLLDAFGRSGGPAWRDWARELANRFRTAFWVSDKDGPYPAIALESAKKPVDGPTSNMGHLLSSGLLSAEEEAVVAQRLRGPALNSGHGLRTLADTAAGFNPLSYHAGSVWPHDTAIAVLRLARSGHPDTAAELLSGLVAAAPAFGYRLPELYSGQRAQWSEPPTPYPGSCRPQAWAAAVGPAIIPALLGLTVDVPAGRLTVSPMAPSPVGAYTIHDIRLGTAGTFQISVDAAGAVLDYDAPAQLTVEYAS